VEPALLAQAPEGREVTAVDGRRERIGARAVRNEDDNARWREVAGGHARK
jgi:hypothetical protein